MAEAGSVAPVFRDGGYDKTAIYDFYHALIHNNKLYFCRQDGTIGHEPQAVSDEYWFLSLDGNFADAASLGGETAEQWQAKVDNILNGTTPVGDSEKLGGKGASEYVTYEFETLNTSILTAVANLPPQTMRVYKLGGGNYTGGDLPSGGTYKYSDAIGFKHDSNTATVILTGYTADESKRIAVNHWNGEWQGWDTNATTEDLANKLDKTGGTVSNSGGIPLTLQGSNVSYVKFTNSSGTQLGLLGAYTDGSPVYSDGSTVNKLLHSGNVGSYALPLTADAQQRLKVGNKYVLCLESNVEGAYETYLSFAGPGKTLGFLGYSAVNTPVFRDNTGKNFALHHDGNSAKVVQATSAPSDTTAVWVDTANKAIKIYKDGAWTALA